MNPHWQWLASLLGTDSQQLGMAVYASSVFIGVPLGGTLAAALILRTPFARTAVAAALGALTALLFIAALGLEWPAALFVLGCAMLAAVGAAVVLRMLTNGRGAAFRAWYARICSPQQWNDLPRPLDGRDAVKRWYVALAAGIGAVIGGLVTDDALIAAAISEWTKPSSILVTLVMTAVYLVLAGPLHERIAGSTLASPHTVDPGEPTFRVDDLASRSLVRMLLVLLAFFALDFVFHCVDESMRNGKWQTLATITQDGVAAAVVSYYCSAALQGAATSVLRRVAGPAFLVGITVTYPGLAALVWGLAGNLGWPMLVGMLLFEIPVAIVIVLFWYVTCALAAGFSLDRFRARHEMVALLASLLATAILTDFATWLLLRSFAAAYGLDPTEIWGVADVLRPLLVVLGWAVGLYASGFPRLVERRRQAQFGAGGAHAVTASDISELAP
jgi:hypothetical protein